MGKKSLIKSTSKKKKNTSKKKDEDKKIKSTSGSKVPKKKTAKKKAAPKKKTAAKKTAPAKKAPAKKAASKKKTTIKDLLLKKFDTQPSSELYAVKTEKKEVSPPPVISTSDKKEAERLKALLLQKIDLKAVPAKKPAAKKAKKPAAKKKAVKADIKEIMARKYFEAPPAESLFTIPEKEKIDYKAPPLISASDKEEAEWLKNLLFRKIDLTTPIEKREPAQALEEKPGEETRPEEKVEKPAAEEPVAKEPPDIKEIMGRKFHEAPPADNLFSVPEKEKIDYKAPPLISASDKEEAEWLKNLLFRKIDLTTPIEKREPPAEPVQTLEEKTGEETRAEEKIEKPAAEEPAEKEPPDIKEIMGRKFHEAPTADSLFSVPEKEKGETHAPPLFSTDDKDEAQRLRNLLFRSFEIPPAPEKPETTETLEPEKEAPEGEPVEPEKAPDAVAPEEAETEEESPKVSVSYEEPPPTETEVSDPMEKMIKYAAAGFVLILLLIIGYSLDNRANYYIKPVPNGVEIWRGNFAPLGAEVIAELEGATAPETVKEVYEAEEVLPMAFDHYIESVDALLASTTTPDLNQVQADLDKALSFATTREQREEVNSRMDSLEALVLQYRANIAAKRGTPESLAAAIAILGEALKLDMDDPEKAMIESKIEDLRTRREELIALKAEAEAQEAAAASEEGAAIEEEITEAESAGGEETAPPEEASEEGAPVEEKPAEEKSEH